MEEIAISAEIEPQPDRAQAAAKALQEHGFRILHIGQTISVEGSESVWRSTFHVVFASRRKTTIPEVAEAGEVSYLAPVKKTLAIPVQLRELVASVSFIEPPELF